MIHNSVFVVLAPFITIGMFRLRALQMVKYKATTARWFLVDVLLLVHLLYQLLFALARHFVRAITRYDPSTSA